MNIFSFWRTNFLAKCPDNEPAAWAFVTGATSGLGHDLAHELASRGFNLVIHGRRADRLEAVSDSLSKKHGCQVRTFCFDASKSVESVQTAWNALETLKDLNLRVLINNVGTGHNPSELATFSTTAPEHIEVLINANLGFMTRMTRALLPVLQKTGTSAYPSFVINVGSLADSGLPYIAVYSGAKAYVRGFSNALDTEMSAEGEHVRVIGSIVGSTDTDGHRIGVDLFTPASTVMARGVVDSAGKCTGGAATPYFGHWIQEWAVRIQPYGLRKLGIIAYYSKLVKEERDKKNV